MKADKNVKKEAKTNTAEFLAKDQKKIVAEVEKKKFRKKSKRS